MHNKQSILTPVVLSLLAASLGLAPVNAQVQGNDPNSNPSLEGGFRNISVQVHNGVANAAGKADNTGLTTIASIVPDPSGGSVSNDGSPGSPGNPGGNFGGNIPPFNSSNSR